MKKLRCSRWTHRFFLTDAVVWRCYRVAWAHCTGGKMTITEFLLFVIFVITRAFWNSWCIPWVLLFGVYRIGLVF
jgi:hypothetical protein